jgi:hypothetical protein
MERRFARVRGAGCLLAGVHGLQSQDHALCIRRDDEESVQLGSALVHFDHGVVGGFYRWQAVWRRCIRT